MHLSIYVSYSQISVFDPSLPNPFNDWSPQHVAQGFSWRPQSVSFRTLAEAGRHDVEILVTDDEVALLASAERAIEVPFCLARGRLIEVASISDGSRVELSPGTYGLRFEGCPDLRIRLVFTRGQNPEVRLFRVDQELNPKYPLLLSSVSA